MQESLTNNIPTPWNEALAELAAPSWDGKDISKKGIRASILDCNRDQILCWVIKLKWSPKGFKLPSYIPRKNRETFKPAGAVFRWLLELCIQCHSKYGRDYNNATEWFAHVFFELIGSTDEPLRNEGIDKYTKAVQKENKLLRCKKTPYSETEEPHTYKLIEAALNHATWSEEFRKSCWNEYLKARTAWVKQLQHSEDMRVLREDRHVPTCPAVFNPRLRCECMKVLREDEDQRCLYTQLPGRGRGQQKVIWPKTVIEQITEKQF